MQHSKRPRNRKTVSGTTLLIRIFHPVRKNSILRSFGLPVHEGKLRVRRLQQANEAFLTSSLRGLRPLVRCAGRPIGDGRPGPWTLRIAEEVRARRLASLKRGSGAGLTPGRLPTKLA